MKEIWRSSLFMKKFLILVLLIDVIVFLVFLLTLGCLQMFSHEVSLVYQNLRCWLSLLRIVLRLDFASNLRLLLVLVASIPAFEGQRLILFVFSQVVFLIKLSHFSISAWIERMLFQNQQHLFNCWQTYSKIVLHLLFLIRHQV